MLKTILALAALAITAQAQTTTTFTMQVAQNCHYVDACTYETLAAPNGDTGYLAVGYPAPQLVYRVPGNPNPEAQYCDGGTFTSSQSTLPNGQVLFVRDCDSNSEGVQGYVPGHLHWEVTAESFQVTHCGRWPCNQTWWAIIAMHVDLTLPAGLPSASSNVDGGPDDGK